MKTIKKASRLIDLGCFFLKITMIYTNKIELYFSAFFISEAACNKADLVPETVLIGFNNPQS